MSELTEYADMVEAAWQERFADTDEWGGVWDYDVTEPFGEAIATHLITEHELPDDTRAKQLLASIIGNELEKWRTDMPTYEKPAFVQLRANKMVGDHVEPAQHRGEVEFYSIYLGEPGSYQWVADFKYHTNALYAVQKMVEAFGCEVDRSQFDGAEDRAIARPYTPGVEKLISARKQLEAGAETATVRTGGTEYVYTQDDLPALRQKILYSM